VAAQRGETRVGDLVEVPRIETVVRLSDRRDAARRAELVASFVPTEEARRALVAVARRLRDGTGSAFVVGGYGSGKSHLLAVLAEAGEAEPLPAADALWQEAGGIGAPPPLAVAVSLVDQAAARPLEEILVEAAAQALGIAAPGQPSRPERWDGLAAATRAAGRRGLLLLVDELSSFLRAKPGLAALREDVRLLQFLGERRETPLWVVATMQETIEAAAQPEPEVSQRLRDRYATLRLTGAHLEEVVAGRLIRHRPGAGAAIAAVRGGLVDALGALPFEPARFDRLYPVYPPTIDHLDAMRHHLSAARGALDFVYRRLVGDPGEGIAPLLAAPAGTLLTPDRLLDHFAVRLAETPETAPLVERVSALYRVEGERLFGPDAALARRVADLLCVEAAGARPRPRTATEVAQALAVAEHAIDPGSGVAHVAAVLERMADAGAYVVREAGAGGGGVRYRVDAEADAALVVERRLLALTAGEGPGEEGRLIDRVLRLLPDDPALPVRALRRDREVTRTVHWERSERRGTVWFGSLTDLDATDVTAWLERLDRPGQDFVLAIAAPAGDAGHAQARAHLDAVLLPAAAGHASAPALLWWVGAPLGDLSGLRRLDALQSLEDELASVETAASARALAVVRDELGARHAAVLRDVVGSVYAGEVVVGQGDTLGTPQALRVLAFAQVVERLVHGALALRHPDHKAVMARGEAPGEGTEAALFTDLLPAGEIAGTADPGLAALVDGVLVPLGLAEKRGRGFRLVTDPGRSPALGALAGAIAGLGAQAPDRSVEAPAVRRALAKGRLGLDERAVRLTLAVAAFAGLVVPVAGGRRVPLTRLSGPEAIDRIEALRPGGGAEDTAVPAALATLPFLAESAGGPYLPAKQRELWARAVKWKAERGDPGAEADALAELSRHPVLADWRLEPAVADLAAAGAIRAAIAVSLPAAEGLARLAAASEAAGPALAQALTRSDAWSTFVRSEVRPLLEADRYLHHPALDALAGGGPDPEGLTGERSSLADRLRRGPGLLDPAERSAWRSALQVFVDRYRERYARAHRGAVGDDPGPALAALDRRHPAAAGDPRARAAHQAVLARHCTLQPARFLDVEPQCACGYHLGDPPLTQAIAVYADLLGGIAGEVAAAGQGATAGPPVPAPARPARDTTPPARTAQRRRLASLAAALAGDGAVPAAELRRRFEAWLMASDDTPVTVEP